MLVAISKKAINSLLIKKRAELKKRQWADDGKIIERTVRKSLALHQSVRYIQHIIL